jgi:hypothetical protein
MLRTEEQLCKLERLTEILNAIDAFDRRIDLDQGSLDGFPGTFSSLRAKYLNDIDTRKRCIEKMWKLYKKELNRLNLEQ